MKRLLFLFTFIFICAIGCRKDYPISTSGTPVFYFTGTVGVTPVNMQAGVNNYYMYSSFKLDTNFVYNFLGELKQNNCVNCNSSIKFQINDDTVSSLNGTTQINNSLTTNYYSIQELDSTLGGSPTKYLVSFTSQPSGSVASYSWDFGDGTTDNTATPNHIYSHPGYYSVCLTINYLNACSSSICNQVKIGVPDAECSIALIDSALSGNNILFSSFQTGNPPYTYIVDFGDGNTLNGTSNTGFNNSHNYANPGIYKVCLEMTDGSGCTSKICKDVSTQGFAGCLANFDFAEQGAFTNPLSLSNVVIKWTDHLGSVYTSNTIPQPNDSYFQIISVASYLINEKNQTTKKLHVKFKCNVSNGNSTLSITNGDAVIAVSYK